MNINNVQDLLVRRLDLTDAQQAEVFSIILDNLLTKTDACEIYFTYFNIEHFLSGYLTHGCLDRESVKQYFCVRLPGWQIQLQQLVNIEASAQASLFIARFLVAKGFYTDAQSVCVSFLAQHNDRKDIKIDQMTHDYLIFLSKEQPEVAILDRFKSLQADFYIEKSQSEAREKLTPNFLENPYEPAFCEYPLELHPLMARLFFNQQNLL